MTVRTRLSNAVHNVYQLDEGLLLVFKPAAYRESAHAHAYTQRLRIVRGRLAVRLNEQTIVLEADSPPLSITAGEEHATEALEPTWLIAESLV